MMYALSHEIGQRRVIGGKSLTTLKQLVNVLRLYYPKNQVKTHEFLDKLNVWISAKDDAIKGSDFEEEIAKLAESSGHKQVCSLMPFLACFLLVKKQAKVSPSIFLPIWFSNI